MMSAKGRNAHLEWEAISDRLITAGFTTHLELLEDKLEFYEKLQFIYDTNRKQYQRDIIILMGDLNAKIGGENTDREEIMEIQGLGEIHENGELFTDLCMENNLLIGGSIFPHKTNNKITWTASGRRA